MVKNYTRTEIDLKIDPIHEKLDDIKGIVKDTLIHVKKTNGRVTDLEVESARRGGGIKVITIVALAIILPIMGWALYILANVDTLIEQGVESELAKYDVTIE